MVQFGNLSNYLMLFKNKYYLNVFNFQQMWPEMMLKRLKVVAIPLKPSALSLYKVVDFSGPMK
jgi:hypothetical protein